MYHAQQPTLQPDTFEDAAAPRDFSSRSERPAASSGRSPRLPLHDLDDELGQIARLVPPHPPVKASTDQGAIHDLPESPCPALPRLEYKYLVPGELLPRLRRMIAPFVETDAHAVVYGTRGYTVRSIYFDTRALDFYHEKLAGLEARKKLRLRGYNGNGARCVVFLEIKRKHAASVTKNRVVYEREAYHGKFDPSQRITFDKNLRGAARPTVDTLFCEDEIRYAMPRHFVLEVKFSGSFPAWLRPIVGALGLRVEAMSKYVTCMEGTFRR
jgi:hypothetical protein